MVSLLEDVPNTDEARRKYQAAAGSYDRRLRATERYRHRAVERLDLKPGDAVLDVACGTGINFPLIEERIGPQGRLVGIDLSAEMLRLAADRVKSQGWENVSLIEAAIEAAQLPGPFDAVLFSLTHDVLQAPDAIERVLRQLKPGGRVASFGSKWAPRWAIPVNLVVWLIARRYVTTFAGFERPWKMLVRQIDLRVESVAFGGAYIAWGTKGHRSTADGHSGARAQPANAGTGPPSA